MGCDEMMDDITLNIITVYNRIWWDDKWYNVKYYNFFIMGCIEMMDDIMLYIINVYNGMII